MFPQSKQSQPTFKFIIRSDLSIDAPSEQNDTTSYIPTLDNNNSLPSELPERTTPSTTQATASTHDTPTLPDNIDRKRKRTEKENGTLANKKVYSHLERWGQSQEELAASQEEVDHEKKVLEQQQQSTRLANPLETDFADYQLMACLLCNRKFKTTQDIARHQALSDLHKINSQDPVAVDKARTKLRRQAAQQTSSAPASTSTSTIQDYATSPPETPITYRNRAAERRQAYNQPECPNLEPRYSKRPPPSTKPSQQTNISKSSEGGSTLSRPMADDNVGAKMLKQMGWKKGQGLGKEGSGIVDPVTAERYAQGAGLGSANAKSRIDSGGGSHSYKDRARELARRRLQEEL